MSVGVTALSDDFVLGVAFALAVIEGRLFDELGLGGCAIGIAGVLLSMFREAQTVPLGIATGGADSVAGKYAPIGLEVGGRSLFCIFVTSRFGQMTRFWSFCICNSSSRDSSSLLLWRAVSLESAAAFPISCTFEPVDDS